MSVDRAAAFETTLARLRQRYALYFNLPPDAREGQQRWIEVTLAQGAARRYPNADVRYRRTYIPSANGNPDAPIELTGTRTAPATSAGERPTVRRRPVSDESRGPSGPYVAGSATEDGGWKKADSQTVSPSPAPAAAKPATVPAKTAPAAAEPERGGWPKVEDYKPAPEQPAATPAEKKKKNLIS